MTGHIGGCCCRICQFFGQPNPWQDEGSGRGVEDIVSLTVILGWKNKKWPSGPTELDLGAGNLVSNSSDQSFNSKAFSL